MTQVFDDKGVVFPATIITAGPMTVTQIKGKEKDGYNAVQVGFGAKKEKNIAKPQLGHTKGKTIKHMREFRMDVGSSMLEVGASLDVSVFTPGDTVSRLGNIKRKRFSRRCEEVRLSRRTTESWAEKQGAQSRFHRRRRARGRTRSQRYAHGGPHGR